MPNLRCSSAVGHSVGWGSPNQCIAKSTDTVILSQTASERRLNSSEAITKINGILKLNGDCPCQIEKPKNVHILTAGLARKRSYFHVDACFIF